MRSIINGVVGVLLVARNLLAGQLANRGLGDARFLMWFFAVAIAWGALEFITMLFNSKRRAIHDWIAGTVVIRQPIEERVASYLTIRGALIVLLILNAIIPRYFPDM